MTPPHHGSGRRVGLVATDAVPNTGRLFAEGSAPGTPAEGIAYPPDPPQPTGLSLGEQGTASRAPTLAVIPGRPAGPAGGLGAGRGNAERSTTWVSIPLNQRLKRW